MYKYVVIVICCCFGCKDKENSQLENDNSLESSTLLSSLDTPFDHKELPSYEMMLAEYKKNLEGKSLEEKKEEWFRLMHYTMPMYWFNTKWDFNGTTRTPNSGSIACGYFVTNLLEDSGISLDRIRLAQAPSSIMIKELCEPSDIQRFSELEKLKSYLLKEDITNDVFIMGLDFHTGFIFREGDELLVFHSDYISGQVILEKLDESKALKASKSYMIGSLMQNNTLFQKLH